MERLAIRHSCAAETEGRIKMRQGPRPGPGVSSFPLRQSRQLLGQETADAFAALNGNGPSPLQEGFFNGKGYVLFHGATSRIS
jgi:hypothetical protein